jgi:hypothetical protein
VIKCSVVAYSLLLASLSPLMAEETMQPPQTKRPNNKIIVSRETTWLTEPLRADGTVDYLAALNGRLSQGVTPENNAAVAFWRAVGPKSIDQKVRKQYFALLGVPELPEEGDYLVPSDAFAPPLPENTPDEKQPWYYLGKCCEKPWTKTDYPLIADLLEKNAKHLDAIVEGVKRPRAYWPQVSEIESPAKLALVVNASAAREAAKQLTARSMLRLGTGDPRGAWEDIMAVHRLGRHVCSGPMLVDRLVGSTIISIAGNRIPVLSQSRKLDASALLQCRKQLLALPPPQPMNDVVEFGERVFALISIHEMAVNKERSSLIKLPDILWSMYDDEQKRNHELLSKLVAEEVDWNEVLRLENCFFDQNTDAMRKPPFQERLEAVSNLEKTLAQDAQLAANEAEKTLTNKKADSKQNAKLVWNMLHAAGPLGSFWGAGTIVETREQTFTDLILLAFSLEAFRREKGRYPKTLDQLVPDYVDAIPADRFVDGKQALKYSADKDGYLLYSVGANGRDDGGRYYLMDRGNQMAAESDAASEEERACDDIAVRSPAKIL